MLASPPRWRVEDVVDGAALSPRPVAIASLLEAGAGADKVDPVLNAIQIARMQDEANRRWHRNGSTESQTGVADLVLRQHRANFDVWHLEDAARSPYAPHATIADVKHAIDRLNQLRNDLVEQIDLALLVEAGAQSDQAPLHSETPGLIVDRLSILALKLYHTAEEAHRESATQEHRARNLERLHILEQQRGDLASCLDQLWSDILGGKRRFRLYRQLKMYNDPELNPVLYTRHDEVEDQLPIDPA